MKNDEYGYVRFTGDYSMLKSMGFTFQKLFANNYMQWAKDGFRVWKRGHDITHDRYNLFKLVRFLETKPVLHQWDKRNGDVGLMFYKFYSNADENIYDYYPYTEENRQRVKDFNKELAESKGEDDMPEYLGGAEFISKETIDFLREWKAMGWFELDYYPED